MRKPLLFMIVALMCHCYHSFSQSTCAQTLRLAQSVYDQGRLHELPNLLENCLESGFTEQERVNAYKLLTLTYIYLEEPVKADDMMLALLNTDNEFRPNDAVDPAEFVALYHTFRTKPIYRLGAKAGAIVSQPSVISSDYANEGTTEYKYGFGFCAAISSEIPLKGKLRNFTLNPELAFQMRAFNSTNKVGENDTIMTVSREVQNWFSLPIALQYDIFKKTETFRAYVSAGFAADFFLLSAAKTISSERKGSAAVEEKTIDVRNNRSSMNIGLIASLGVKQKFGKGYIVAEARYQYNLLPSLSVEDVYSDVPTIFDYKTVDGPFRLQQLSLSIGYVMNRYHPRKLTRK